MSAVTSQFVFMTCRPGAETALKREVARSEPMWRLAFSRPGFLTFKVDDSQPLDARKLAERRWILAHSHGVSLGKLNGTELNDLAEQFWRTEGIARLTASETSIADIHVWQSEAALDSVASGSEQGNAATYDTPLAIEIEHAIKSAAPESLVRIKKTLTDGATNRRRHASPHGGLVLDVFVLEPGQWWIGCHRAQTSVERWPGGQVPAPLPEHAVSRAYAKLEEAIAWSGLPLAAGDECVEIGCAPGGACQALLERGLFVTGIDPADVDPALLENSRFRHLKKRGKEVRRAEFLGVRWLVADMNIAPEATLDDVEPIVTHPGVAIRGLVLTLKLSSWDAAAKLEEFAQRVRGWGYRDVRMRQLVSGGQEVCLVALRRKALRRIGRKTNRKLQGGRSAPKAARGERGRHGAKQSPRKTADDVVSTRVDAPPPTATVRLDLPHSDLPAPHF